MASLFPVVPALRRVLEIAQQDASKRGHTMQDYERLKELTGIVYSCECSICHCTVKVICSAYEYKRYGTAYGQNCKPG